MRIRENRAIALVEKVIIYIVALWYLSSGAEAKHISENRLFLSTSEAWPGIVSAIWNGFISNPRVIWYRWEPLFSLMTNLQ
jgi:hypothetical protein